MSLETQTTEAPAAAEQPAPMTRDDLVGVFAAQLAAENDPPKAEAPAEAAAPADTESAPDEGVDEAGNRTEPGSDPQIEEPASPTLNAPTGMSDEDRQKFAQLPPDVQNWLTKREADRRSEFTRKTQEAAEMAKAASAERQKLGSQLQQYDAFLTSITSQRIEPPDPAMQMTDPDGYQQALGNYVTAKHRQEQAAAEQARVASERRQIEDQGYREFVQTESSKLIEIMPEFGDPKKAPELRKAVIAYAEQNGFAEALGRATAAEIKVLTQSMRYEAAQKAAKSAPVVAPSAPRSTKPGPAKAAGSRTSGFASAVSNLTASGSRAALAEAYAAELSSER